MSEHKFFYFSPYLSPDDNKRNYRELAVRYHPDKNQNNKIAEEKFKSISNEYNKLVKYQKENGILSPEKFDQSKFNSKFGAGVTYKQGSKSFVDDIVKEYFTADQKVKEEELEKLAKFTFDGLYKILTGKNPPKKNKK